MAISLRGVEKRLGDFFLGPIDLEVEKGGRVAVIGPSGSGKSTLLRIVAGLLKPDKGRVYIGGEDVTDKPPWARGVGVVFQSPALFPSLTVLENVAEPLLSRGVRRDEAFEKARRVLEKMGLGGFEERYPSELSRGQQQRVALARALVVEPEVLLLDEPLTALDAPLKNELLPYIYEVARGRTVLYVTHDFEEATYISERVVVIMGGKVAAEGKAAELFENPPSPHVAKLLGYSNVLKAPCGYLYFRPWDVEGEGPLEGKVVGVWYRAGRYEVVAVVGEAAVRLILAKPPASSTIRFKVSKGVCFPQKA